MGFLSRILGGFFGPKKPQSEEEIMGLYESLRVQQLSGGERVGRLLSHWHAFLGSSCGINLLGMLSEVHDGVILAVPTLGRGRVPAGLALLWIAVIHLTVARQYIARKLIRSWHDDELEPSWPALASCAKQLARISQQLVGEPCAVLSRSITEQATQNASVSLEEAEKDPKYCLIVDDERGSGNYLVVEYYVLTRCDVTAEDVRQCLQSLPGCEVLCGPLQQPLPSKTS